MKGPLIALALGVAAYLVTREVVVGVLVAAIGWWFFRESPQNSRQRRTIHAPLPSTPRGPTRPIRDEEGIEVVCKQVTLERQEWVSVRTGRLFEVLSPDGPENARPGDHAQLFISGTRHLVRRPLEPNR